MRKPFAAAKARALVAAPLELSYGRVRTGDRSPRPSRRFPTLCCIILKEPTMLGILTILLISLTPPEHSRSRPDVSPAAFQAWFDAALNGRLSIPADVDRSAQEYRYVFVGGFHSERFSGYFAQNAKELRKRGVPRRAIHYIYPSSRETVADNARAFRKEIREIAREGPEKLVVIGHSRGACDALAFALANPEFVEDRVEALFLVQGAFGGTGAADYFSGDGPPIDKRMPWRQRLVAHLLARFEGYLLDHGKHDGLAGLTTSESKAFWEWQLHEHRAAIPIVSSRTFYVTTRTDPERLRLFQKAIASYLAYVGPNDGIIALEGQSLPDVGTVVAVLDAGHTDLTNRFPSARCEPRLRRALIDAIVMAVAERLPEALPADEIRQGARGGSSRKAG
jgi:pimeloyl-ACP methyl ester carboxylesterase